MNEETRHGVRLGLKIAVKNLIFLTIFIFSGTPTPVLGQALDRLDRKLLSEEEPVISERELSHPFVTLTLRVAEQFQSMHPVKDQPPQTEDQLVFFLFAKNIYGKELTGYFVFEKSKFENISSGATLTLVFENQSYVDLIIHSLIAYDLNFSVIGEGVTNDNYFENPNKKPAIFRYGLGIKP